jgi:hypothetical protein
MAITKIALRTYKSKWRLAFISPLSSEKVPHMDKIAIV